MEKINIKAIAFYVQEITQRQINYLEASSYSRHFALTLLKELSANGDQFAIPVKPKQSLAEELCVDDTKLWQGGFLASVWWNHEIEKNG